ncbi:MAG: hypothetical protein DWQ34_26385 [Planctomycetota bacterium]|nr:MAG: hypothetical protein DWQ29_16930 [Planctomycetota bacterium]REJ86813.1 MAG: hypothetical protein DWQ34_26385 [Planctomycetota bacterium]REK22753.1 MAG: hypothetical protein DWQ41_18290 [Planctomycetota bacterium]REK33827.1 MAG: hypothetical protein DWQ45_14700 [Planctomycetota bacterium]
MPRMRLLLVTAVLTCLCFQSGCQFFPHWMHPRQWQKLNRQQAWDDAQFSIPDPADPRLSVPTSGEPQR